MIKEKALLTHLRKVFECLSNAYNFDIVVLNPIQSYPSNRKQKTKINLTYISSEKILLWVTERYILVSLSSNIFLSDLFGWYVKLTLQFMQMINATYVSGNSIGDVIKLLKVDSTNLCKWFLGYQTKGKWIVKLITW